jgi:hypothetical protein
LGHVFYLECPYPVNLRLSPPHSFFPNNQGCCLVLLASSTSLSIHLLHLQAPCDPTSSSSHPRMTHVSGNRCSCICYSLSTSYPESDDVTPACSSSCWLTNARRCNECSCLPAEDTSSRGLGFIKNDNVVHVCPTPC